MLWRHDRLVQRKAELEEEACRKTIEAERKAHELREQQERDRIECLSSSANALQQAQTIRTFIRVISEQAGKIAFTQEEIKNW